MKKFCSILLIALSLLSNLCSKECDCFQLKPQSYQYRLFFDSLQNCMTELPKIKGLYFFDLEHPLILINNGYDDPKETLDFYWARFFFSYSTKGIINLFSKLHEDADEELLCWKKIKEEELADLSSGRKHCHWVDGNGERQCIPSILKQLAKAPSIKKTAHEVISRTEEDFYFEFTKIMEYCKTSHQTSRAFYESGCWNFLMGNCLEAIEDGIVFINLTEKEGKNEQLVSETYLQQGEAFAEVLAYDQAIEALTKAIELNPQNKNAYFERSVSYFEKGNFDRAFEDYVLSEIRPTPIDNNLLDHLNFSLGLSIGVLKGGMEATQEFIPSLLASFQGLSQGLWAFAQDPVQMSSELVLAAHQCIEFVKENSSQEVLLTLVPELQDLIGNWKDLDSQQKGTLTGHIIGKYGVDIFAGVGLTKGMQLYRNLKRANNVLTFEAMRISETNRKLIPLEAIKKAEARQQGLKSNNLKILWDKQGKHIENHKNFDPDIGRSIFVHSDPQSLANRFCGKGMRIGKAQPGTAGYQEIVNFGEFIGYDVDKQTGVRLATTWGKIHYANDGVHIVPTKPRG